MGSAFGGEWSRLKDSNGKPPGMIGVLPQNAVTFIDNQDTESRKIWPFPTDYVMLGLCHSQLIISPISRRRKISLTLRIPLFDSTTNFDFPTFIEGSKNGAINKLVFKGFCWDGEVAALMRFVGAGFGSTTGATTIEVYGDGIETHN